MQLGGLSTTQKKHKRCVFIGDEQAVDSAPVNHHGVLETPSRRQPVGSLDPLATDGRIIERERRLFLSD